MSEFLKYIGTPEGVILFTTGDSHLEFSHRCRVKPEHAGFAGFNGEGKVKFWGESVSLRLQSQKGLADIQNWYTVTWRNPHPCVALASSEAMLAHVTQFLDSPSLTDIVYWSGVSQPLTLTDEYGDEQRCAPWGPQWPDQLARVVLQADGATKVTIGHSPVSPTPNF